MSRVGDVFSEVGRRLGLGLVDFVPPGPLALEVEGAGLLTFETNSNDDLLTSFAWPVADYDRLTLPKAFEACALEVAGTSRVSAGLLDGRLLLMSRLRENDLSAPAVEALILRLVKLGESLKSA
jgi:hypothetical protein